MKLPTSFFLCLIGMLSLSACAQPLPAETAKPAEQKTLVTVPEPIANEPIPAKTNTSNKDMTTMIYPDNPSTGPAITAVELQKKILALVASLQSRDDTNLANVEKIMAAKLTEDADSGGRFSMRGEVKEGWGYWYFVDKVHEEPASTIYFHLLHGEEVPDDALPKTCTIEFEPLAKELVALGYERSDKLFRRTWGFGKSYQSQNIGFGIGVKVYRVDNGSEDGVECVESIRIGSGVLNE